MKRANSKRHKSFLGGIERIKDEPHSDRSIGVKWHNMAEPAMMTGSLKALNDCGNVNGLKVFITL